MLPCAVCGHGDSLIPSMRMRAFIRVMTKVACPFAQRTIAFLLLALVSFLVVNPIWECHDHLDTLRHLGPHGALIILLMVALAGVSLLRVPRWLLLFVRWNIAGVIASVAVPRPISADLSAPLVAESGPPLRI